ncbi:MAG: Zn-ribbon domain-containing OB-fold protein [Myxococcota bacterium]
MTRWFPDGMPQPMADNDSVPWWQAAAEHRLLVQRCIDCSHQRLPAAPICPSCRSDAADWQEVSGRGELYTYTIVHRPIAAGQELPFVIAVIELDGAEGVRLISNLVETALEDLKIGMPVEVVWEDMSPDLSIPRFRALRE